MDAKTENKAGTVGKKSVTKNAGDLVLNKKVKVKLKKDHFPHKAGESIKIHPNMKPVLEKAGII